MVSKCRSDLLPNRDKAASQQREIRYTAADTLVALHGVLRLGAVFMFSVFLALMVFIVCLVQYLHLVSTIDHRMIVVST